MDITNSRPKQGMPVSRACNSRRIHHLYVNLSGKVAVSALLLGVDEVAPSVAVVYVRVVVVEDVVVLVVVIRCRRRRRNSNSRSFYWTQVVLRLVKLDPNKLQGLAWEVLCLININSHRLRRFLRDDRHSLDDRRRMATGLNSHRRSLLFRYKMTTKTRQ